MPSYSFKWSTPDADDASIVVRNGAGTIVATGTTADVVAVTNEAFVTYTVDLPAGDTYTATATVLGRSRSTVGVLDTSAATLTATFAPKTTANRFAGEVARVESDVLAGLIPVRVSPTPTIVFSKGSGITGTPTVSAGGTGYTVNDILTLVGGTPLVAAQLKVTSVSAGVVTGLAVYRNGLYPGAATPANAVAVTGGTGTGATFTVAWSVNGQSTSLTRQSIGPTDARFRWTGHGTPGNLGASGYYGDTVSNGTHSSFEWATDSQRLDIKLTGLNTSVMLYVDGKQVNAPGAGTDASGVSYIWSFDFGSQQFRNFKLVGVNMAFGGVFIDGIGATLPTLTAPFSAPRPLTWVLGDSYAFGTGAETTETTSIFTMCDRLGLDVIPDGIGGTGWLSTTANSPTQRITDRLVTLNRTPAYVFLDLGYNDGGGNMTTLATNLDATIAAVKAAVPSAKIIAFGPATPQGRTTALDTVRDTISARCAAGGVTFVDVGDWVNSGNKVLYTGADNIHPTYLGHKYLGARRAEVVRTLI